MATVPSLTAKVAGNRIRATDFNATKDYLDYLIDTPHCSVWNSTGVTLVNSTLTLVPWNTETDDTDGMHSTSSNTGRVVFITPGRYSINCYITIDVVTSFTVFEINIRLNSGGSAAGGSSIRTFDFGSNIAAQREQTFTLTRVFGASDYVEIFVRQVSGGADRVSDTNGQYCTGFQARYIGIS